MNRLSNQKKREKRRNNRFYERFSFVLIFVLLVFTGLAFFVNPKEKFELKFDKLVISEDAKAVKDNGISITDEKLLTKEEINEAINENITHKENRIKENDSLTFVQKQYIAEIKRKKIHDILRKQQSLVNRQKDNTPLNKKTYNNGQGQKLNPYGEFAETKNNSLSVPVNIFDELPISACSPNETEYVLNLYSSLNRNKPLTLVFRKNGNFSQNKYPEIIHATLPNNQWRDLEENIGEAMNSLFDELFTQEDKSDDTKTKISSMITTPCSNSAYISQAFYVSKSTPYLITPQRAEAYCLSKNGRLPDILEIMSVIKHKKIPYGYYITNSEILTYDNNLKNWNTSRDFLVLNYTDDNMFFTFTSKLPPSQNVFSECILNR